MYKKATVYAADGTIRATYEATSIATLIAQVDLDAGESAVIEDYAEGTTHHYPALEDEELPK